MKSETRRKEIAGFLMAQQAPVPGGELARRFGVSRQIIVQDIAVLKAAGFTILSTHQGYIVHQSPLAERVFKVCHTQEQTEDELNRIVDLGGTVVDVFVWHRVYGKMQAKLNIFSRLQVRQFIEGIRSGKSTELMSITGGYHYHTIRADSEGALDRIGEALAAYIVPEI